MKVVINTCYGGFSLSYEGVMEYARLTGKKIYAYVSEMNDFTKYKEYDGKAKDLLVHYSERKLKDGKLSEEGCFSDRDIPRNDPNLIKVVETLGKKADGYCAQLKVIEIPDGIDWQIDEYDGLENVEEKHRRWS